MLSLKLRAKVISVSGVFCISLCFLSPTAKRNESFLKQQKVKKTEFVQSEPWRKEFVYNDGFYLISTVNTIQHFTPLLFTRFGGLLNNLIFI